MQEVIKDLIHSVMPEINLITADNGLEGLATLISLQAADQLPDLVLTDLRMPFMEGLEMVNLIKKNPKLDFIPIIILSASFDIENPHNLVFIEKPIDVTVLLENIEDHLIRYGVRIEVC